MPGVVPYPYFRPALLSSGVSIYIIIVSPRLRRRPPRVRVAVVEVGARSLETTCGYVFSVAVWSVFWQL